MTTIRAWSRKQNHHQGPKVSLAKVKNQTHVGHFFLFSFLFFSFPSFPLGGGGIDKAYEPEGQITNGEFYIQVLDKLLKQILKVSSQF
jgi:hypothetical protein